MRNSFNVYNFLKTLKKFSKLILVQNLLNLFLNKFSKLMLAEYLLIFIQN